MLSEFCCMDGSGAGRKGLVNIASDRVIKLRKIWIFVVYSYHKRKRRRILHAEN